MFKKNLKLKRVNGCKKTYMAGFPGRLKWQRDTTVLEGLENCTRSVMHARKPR